MAKTTACECEVEKPGVGMCMCTLETNANTDGPAICSRCAAKKHQFPDGSATL